MTMQQWAESDTQPWAKHNENMDSLAGASVYGIRQPAVTGLTWAYWGGYFDGAARSQGTVSLTNSATNYIVLAKADHTVSASTATTNWDNSADYWRIGVAVTAGGVITSYVDARFSPGGALGGGGGGAAPDQHDAAAVVANEIDLSDAAISVWEIDVDDDISDITLPSTTGADVLSLLLLFTQDSTGGHTVTGWPVGIIWEGGAAPTIDTTADATTSVALVILGNGNIYGVGP